MLTILLVMAIVDATHEVARARLLVAWLGMSAATAAWYFRYQHIYLVFVVTYSLMIVSIVAALARLALAARPDDALAERTRRDVIRPLFVRGVLYYVCCGFFAWCTDMLFCETVSTMLLGGIFLHPVWHLGAGLGTWYAIEVVVAARAARLGDEPKLVWLGGLLGFVEY